MARDRFTENSLSFWNPLAWKVEDEGELSDLLGVEFSHTDEYIELNKQSAYIEKLCAEFFEQGVPRPRRKFREILLRNFS